VANLTIVVEDELLRRARVRAAEKGISVNRVLRDYLKTWAEGEDRRAVAVEVLLRGSKQATSRRGERSWTRDELHER
jgi:plasmid stability protein